MTVRELIETVSELDPDMPVVTEIIDANGGYTGCLSPPVRFVSMNLIDEGSRGLRFPKGRYELPPYEVKGKQCLVIE